MTVINSFGYERINNVTVAKHWHNGQSASLTNGDNRAEALSVFLY